MFYFFFFDDPVSPQTPLAAASRHPRCLQELTFFPPAPSPDPRRCSREPLLPHPHILRTLRSSRGCAPSPPCCTVVRRPVPSPPLTDCETPSQLPSLLSCLACLGGVVWREGGEFILVLFPPPLPLTISLSVGCELRGLGFCCLFSLFFGYRPLAGSHVFLFFFTVQACGPPRGCGELCCVSLILWCFLMEPLLQVEACNVSF